VIVVLAAAFFAMAAINYLQQSAPSPQPTSTPVPTTPMTPAPTPSNQPLPAPKPETWEEATQWLTDNALYGSSLPAAVDCRANRFDASTATLSELQHQLDQSIDCLQRAWEEPVTAAGFTLPRPPGHAFDLPVTTACGDSSVSTAFYCGLDQRIYISLAFPGDLPAAQRANPFALADTMAHEFGHHVQMRSGIFVAASAWKHQSERKDALEYSRRTELQADCLDGLWLAVVRRSSGVSATEQTGLKKIVYELGDDTAAGLPPGEGDHGQGANRLTWYNTGLEHGPGIGVCNTYSASAKQVR
jgi:predicted metalloprotease